MLPSTRITAYNSSQGSLGEAVLLPVEKYLSGYSTVYSGSGNTAGHGAGVSHAEMWKAGLAGKMVRKRDVTEAGGRVRHRSKVGNWSGRTMENMV